MVAGRAPGAVNPYTGAGVARRMPDLRRIRRDAEALVRAMALEVYENHAGLKPELHTAAIFARHAGLLTKEVLQNIRARRLTAGVGAEATRLRFLERFLTTAHQENAVRDVTDRLGTEEARREVVVDHHILPFRSSAVRMANEDDRVQRGAIFTARNEVIGALNTDRRRRWRTLHALAKELGFRDYLTCAAELHGLDLAVLGKMGDDLVARTDRLWETRLGEVLAPLDLAPRQAEKHDIAYAFRGKAWDREFRKERAVATLKDTLLDLGLDLDAQANIHVDVEERANKSPRAFCVPAQVPERVILVMLPQGGHDDYATILHEAGHAEHYANMSRKLPFEFRYLGDNSVTEAMAFALEYITLSPLWLEAKVGLRDSEEFLRFLYTYKAYFVRRHVAKLRYERQLHSQGPDGMEATYQRELERVLLFRHPRTHYLLDVDDGLYAALYLRAWILEAQMSQALREMFGEAWFREKEAGRFLRGIWAHGQEHTAEDLAGLFGFPGLDAGPLAAQLEQRLA
jgi:hypothetical protein